MVEVLRCFEFVGLLVIVGGCGDFFECVVVLMVLYEVCVFGIGFGMLFKIVVCKVFDDVVFLLVDYEVYEVVLVEVMMVLWVFLGIVFEVVGWDECFFGVMSDDLEVVVCVV